jgi:hypothetical protein
MTLWPPLIVMCLMMLFMIGYEPVRIYVKVMLVFAGI